MPELVEGPLQLKKLIKFSAAILYLAVLFSSSLLFLMKGYVYILLCSDGSYYTGSTTDLELRLAQHQNGVGSNHTKKRLPVTLVYYKEFDRIADAFLREKQIQKWSRKKKEALINGDYQRLAELSKNYTQYQQ